MKAIYSFQIDYARRYGYEAWRRVLVGQSSATCNTKDYSCDPETFRHQAIIEGFKTHRENDNIIIYKEFKNG